MDDRTKLMIDALNLNGISDHEIQLILIQLFMERGGTGRMLMADMEYLKTMKLRQEIIEAN